MSVRTAESRFIQARPSRIWLPSARFVSRAGRPAPVREARASGGGESWRNPRLVVRRAPDGVKRGPRRGGDQRACKPDSVPFRWVGPEGGGHLSGRRVAATLTRPTRECERAGRSPPHFGLAPGGACTAAPSPGRRCALTAPFHPYPQHAGGMFLLRFPSARAARGLPGALARRSPDFPQRDRNPAAAARPADRRPPAYARAPPARYPRRSKASLARASARAFRARGTCPTVYGPTASSASTSAANRGRSRGCFTR